MIYCPSCGIANREGSRFCNECGAKLPSGTSIRCPQCGTPNAPNAVFCEKCGTRLIASLVSDEPDEPEPVPVKKGLSLPSKLSVPADDDDIPDWLAQLSGEPAPADSSSEAATSPEPGEAAADDAPPAWLNNLMGAQPAPEQPPHADEPPAEKAPDWLASLRSAPSEDVPEWLDQLGEHQAGGEASANAADDDTPEWLKQLSEAVDMPAESSGTAVPAGLNWSAALQAPSPEGDEPLAEEVPDWLSNLSEASAAAEAEPPASIESPVPEAPVPDAGELPDWLLGLNQPEPAAPPADEPPAQTDWLGQLRAAAPVVDEEPLAEAEPAAESPADWLSALSADQPESADALAPQKAAREPVAIEPPSGEGEIPDWLSALGLAAPVSRRAEPETPPEIPSWAAQQPEPPAAEQPVAGEPTIDEARPQTDWLGALRAAAPMADEEPAEETALPSSDLPDWLAGSAAEPPIESAAEPTPPEAEIPDWLRDLGLASTPAAAPADEQAGEVPDWLRAADTGPAAAQAEVSESAAPQAEDEIPDWLRGAEPAAYGESLPPSGPEPAAPVSEESEPDWLSVIRSAQEPAESEYVETPAEGESVAEVPDWLKEPEPPAASVSAEPAAEEPAAEGELPDWLRTLGTVEAAASGEPSGGEEPIGAAEPAHAAPAEIPEWLSTLRPEEAAPPVPAPAESTHEEAREESPEASQTPEPVVAELPEWLTSLRERRPPVVPPSAAEPVPGLTQAEIPTWLEALRPAEGKAAEPVLPEDFGEVEQEGVFAGVAHTLPPAPLMGEIQGKPDRLQVEISAEDMTRAGVLQQLLAQGASGPRAAPSLPVRASARRGLQWLMAVLVLVAVSVPFLLQSGLSILPKVQTLPASPLLQTAVSRVAALPDGARVLVVFDYDASQAGEMNPLADAMLRHLLARHADITVTSLNPIGPALAQSAWEAIEPGAREQGQWRNLGYIAGQSIGAQEALLKTGPVELVVELAASPDALRWWIEQRGLLGQATPLIAAVSTATEPLALPYAQSQQVAGLVSGVAGATVYAREAQVLTPRTTVSKQVQLEALTLANWLMAAIVLIALVVAVLGRKGKGNPA